MWEWTVRLWRCGKVVLSMESWAIQASRLSSSRWAVMVRRWVVQHSLVGADFRRESEERVGRCRLKVEERIGLASS